jgi:hypothetical protein
MVESPAGLRPQDDSKGATEKILAEVKPLDDDS